MHKAILTALFLALFLLRAPGTAHSQAPVQNVDEEEPEAAETQPQPEPPAPQKPVTVEVKDGLLSVEAVDAQFGNIMREIAAKMHFQVSLNNEVSDKKITTRFSGLDSEAGIKRLFALVREQNYLIRYDAKGDITGIQMYASNPSGPAAGSPVARRMIVNRSNAFRRSRYRRFLPPQPAPQSVPQPAQQPQTQTPLPPAAENSDEEE